MLFIQQLRARQDTPYPCPPQTRSPNCSQGRVSPPTRRCRLPVQEERPCPPPTSSVLWLPLLPPSLPPHRPPASHPSRFLASATRDLHRAPGVCPGPSCPRAGLGCGLTPPLRTPGSLSSASSQLLLIHLRGGNQQAGARGRIPRPLRQTDIWPCDSSGPGSLPREGKPVPTV